ncbi:MAG: class I SAM-dependent methyltransferase [Rhizomicrobium sp.]
MATKEDQAADLGVEFDVPKQFRRGTLLKNQKASVDSAVKTIEMTARELGAADLSNTTVLDIGCGVKFTQAFYGRRVPVKRYHGIDVDPGMIAFLSENVKDGRFTYRHIDAYNERYNKTGQPLSVDTDIGTNGELFDLVCLFSVFTHLAPPDYRAMLELARKYVSSNGKLIFTTFIDDTISGHFKDLDPDKPLLMAVYREDAVREFVTAADWSVHRLFVKGKKSWLVCAPI